MRPTRLIRYRAVRVPLIVLAWAVAIYRLADAVTISRTAGYVDFAIFYKSAHCILEGCARYGPPAEANLTPPFAQWVFVPFAYLPIDVAYMAWTASTFALLAIGAALTIRELPEIDWAVVLPIMLTAAPIPRLVTSGQVTALLLVPLVIAWSHDRAGRPLPAWSVALGAWKPMLGLLLVRRMRYRTLAMAAATCLVLALLLDPLAAYVGWLRTLNFPMHEGHPNDASLWQFIARTCQSSEWYTAAWSCADGTRALSLTLALGLALITLRPRQASTDAWWLSLIAAGLLASPRGWIYYGAWLMPPALGVWVRGTRLQRCALLTALALALGPWQLPLWGQPSGVATITIGSIYTWSYVCCWMAGISQESAFEPDTSVSSFRVFLSEVDSQAGSV